MKPKVYYFIITILILFNGYLALSLALGTTPEDCTNLLGTDFCVSELFVQIPLLIGAISGGLLISRKKHIIGD